MIILSSIGDFCVIKVLYLWYGISLKKKMFFQTSLDFKKIICKNILVLGEVFRAWNTYWDLSSQYTYCVTHMHEIGYVYVKKNKIKKMIVATKQIIDHLTKEGIPRDHWSCFLKGKTYIVRKGESSFYFLYLRGDLLIKETKNTLNAAVKELRRQKKLGIPLSKEGLLLLEKSGASLSKQEKDRAKKARK